MLVVASAHSQSAPTGFGALADQLKELFPTIEGEVLEARDTTLTISVGRRDGLHRRVELEVYREGRELRHPRTREVLGRAEQSVGRATVVEVFEAYATATLREGSGARLGDRVRLTSGKVKLTLLPASAGVKDDMVEATLRELIEGINRTGRFQVAMGDQVSVWLAERGIKTAEFLEGKGLAEAAERFKVGYLLAVNLRNVQKRPYLEARLLVPPSSEALLSTGLFVPSTVAPSRSGQFSAGPARPEAPRKARSLLARILFGELETGKYSAGEGSIPLKEVARFGFPVFAMDVALSPKDQVPRIALTDGIRIYVYRLGDGVLEAEWSYTGWRTGRIIGIQLADLDGDGEFEVVVNGQSAHSGMSAAIIAAPGRRATVVADYIPDILLAVDAKGEGRKTELWGQRYSEQTFFTPGQAERLVLKEGRLVSAGQVRVPSEFRATGATFSNIAGKESRALVFVDARQQLRITADGQDLWQSSTKVGGGYTGAEIPQTDSRTPTTRYVPMEPFPVSVDLDGDGIEEVVIPQNQQEGFLAVVYRGPGGFRLQSVNSGFEGVITALGAVPPREGGTPTLVVALVRFAGLGRTSGETRIIVTASE